MGNPRPAETPRQLVIQGGFVVDNGRIRRLERRAGQLGFADLRSYPKARCNSAHSVPRLAQELGVSVEHHPGAGHAGHRAATPPAAAGPQRRRHAQERIAARVAALGFADVRA